MRPNKAETVVHGCHCSGDMAVRMLKLLARPWVGVRVCHLLLLLFYRDYLFEGRGSQVERSGSHGEGRGSRVIFFYIVCSIKIFYWVLCRVLICNRPDCFFVVVVLFFVFLFVCLFGFFFMGAFEANFPLVRSDPS